MAKPSRWSAEKDDRYNPYVRITHIGGKNTDSSRWRITQKDAIQGIETGKWEFYVSRNGYTVEVIVAVSPLWKQVHQDGG